MSSYSHLRSAPVVVDAGLRKEWEPPARRAGLVGLHAPCLDASSMAARLSDDERDQQFVVVVAV